MRYPRSVMIAASLWTATDLLPPSARAQSGPEQTAIATAEQTWAEALMGRDVGQVERVPDPRFRLIMADTAASADRGASLQLSDEQEYKSMVANIESVVVRGNVAVAVVEMNVGWPDGFPSAPSDWEFIDRWVNSAGTWRTVSRAAQTAEQPVKQPERL